MATPLFMGIDPSFNGFAIVIIDQNSKIIDQVLIKTKSEDEIEDRIIYLEQKFKYITNLTNLKVIYIEGPSFSSSGAFMLQMGALHYYLRVFFRKNNLDFKIITPNAIKKFVTGKGIARKELMLLKVYKRWGIEFEDNNLCDAYSLARLALEEYQVMNAVD